MVLKTYGNRTRNKISRKQDLSGQKSLANDFRTF